MFVGESYSVIYFGHHRIRDQEVGSLQLKSQSNQNKSKYGNEQYR